MQVAILAGGLGTRLGEETGRRPKALVEVGGRPILWHIMHYYAHFGFTEFLIALGYLGHLIDDYVTSDPDIPPEWRIRPIDTGSDTQTGGRIGRLGEVLDDAPFLLTWCDGVSTVDLGAMVEVHRRTGDTVTIGAVHPPARFGELGLDGDRVVSFREKPARLDEWINGGVFAVDPAVFDLIEGDNTDWDREVLPALARDGRLGAYRHEGFWQCMDTMKDKNELEKLWKDGSAPWKVWE